MIVSARKAVAFLEKHAHRVTDPIVRPSPEEVARLRREARLLLFGATTVERPLLWRFLAACETELGDLPAALDMLQKAREANPADVGIVSDIGAALGHMGRTAEALACFREVEHLAGEHEGMRLLALLNQARALDVLGERDVADAVLRRALAGPVPSEYDALVRFAEMSAQLGRDGDAVEFLARALCTKAGRPRGDAAALDLLDRYAPGVENGTVADSRLAEAIRAVRARELDDPPPEMSISGRVVLPSDAWDALSRLLPA